MDLRFPRFKILLDPECYSGSKLKTCGTLNVNLIIKNRLRRAGLSLSLRHIPSITSLACLDAFHTGSLLQLRHSSLAVIRSPPLILSQQLAVVCRAGKQPMER